VLGIGRATSHQFAENGAKAIYLCDFDDSNLESHKRDINAAFPKVEVHVRQFDAGNEEAVKEVVGHAIKTYGRLDVFFANAGIVGKPLHFKDVEKDEFMKVMETNAARSVQG
jgi:NAD(P)-dependent dehydrogenase (short-subunit alcohol dehydrogenase family)